MDKNSIISKLTLLDTSSFRCIGFSKTGKYTKEPLKFRSNLHKLYNNLSLEDLNELLKLRTNKK